MRYIVIILIFILGIVDATAQTKPSGFPTQLNTGWQRWGWSQSDSGLIPARRDTTFLPRFSGTMVFRPQDRQYYYYDSTDLRWYSLIQSAGDSSFVYVDYIPQASAPSYSEGRLWYDDGNNTLSFYDQISGTSLQIGQENVVYARNNTGSQINNGQAVYVTGSLGQNPTIALARSNALSTTRTLGVATHDISNNSTGKITTFGLVNDINTSAFSAGDRLYLSSSTPGALTNVVPDTPNYVLFVGFCLTSHVNQGKILVDPEKTASRIYQITDTSFVVNEDTIKIHVPSSPSSGVTSVALSMPSAFNVSGSPITTSGTFAVSGAGTSAQYIRGNGTLATFDTSAIPSFSVKVRSLFSGSSPITYDQSSGTFSLADLTTAGACTGCNLTINSKGQIVLYSSGTGSGDTAINVGSGVGLFKEITTDTFNFKSLTEGYGINLSNNTNDVGVEVDTTQIATQYDLTQTRNISNASLTADADYVHDWDNHSMTIGNISKMLVGTTTDIGGAKFQVGGVIATNSGVRVSDPSSGGFPFVSFYNHRDNRIGVLTGRNSDNYMSIVADSADFGIHTGGGAGPARLTVKTSGRVAIGTNFTTPQFMLHINGSVGSNKDSANLLSSITSQNILLIDTADNGKYKRIPVSALNSLPSQTGNGSMFLQTDGSTASWQFPLNWIDVTNYGAIDDSSTDCTTPIQNAINAVSTAGGGVLYFPVRDKGVYLVKGPLIQNVIARVPLLPNSQLYIPNGTGLGAASVKSITFMGERSPSMELGILATNYPNVWNKTAIIQSTLKNPGPNPSTGVIFAQPALLGVSADSLGSDVWNTTEVFLENLVFRTCTKSNTNTDTTGTMSALNFGNATALDIKNCRIDITTVPFNSLLPDSTYGVIMPHNGNSAWNKIANSLISGYYTGIVATEHTDMDYVSFMGNYHAIESPEGDHDWHAKRILLNGNVNGIYVTGESYFKIDNYDAEHITPLTATVWYNFQNDVLATNVNFATGNINYHIVTSNVGPDNEKFKSNATPSLLAASPLYQNATPTILKIGNGVSNASWGPSFYNPQPVSLEIGRDTLSNGSTFVPSIVLKSNMNLASGGLVANEAIINTNNNKILWNRQVTTYISNQQAQIKEYMTTSAPANINVLTRSPFVFQLGVPFQPHIWTTAGRPVTGVATSMLGWNSDTAMFEFRSASAWEALASRNWVRSQGYGTIPSFTGIAYNSSGTLSAATMGDLLQLSGSTIDFNTVYMDNAPNNHITLKSRMHRQSFTVADANFTTLNTRQEGYFILPEITANRTFDLFTGSGVDGVEFFIYNLNTSGTFSWTFSGATIVKASATGTPVTALPNGALYHILGTYDGSTAKWIIVNQ